MMTAWMHLIRQEAGGKHVRISQAKAFGLLKGELIVHDLCVQSWHKVCSRGLLVAKSLREGLFWLAVLFTVIALIVGRRVRTTAAMIFSLSLLPASIFGGGGLFHAPVDIIAASAANICIGIAIDLMVHLIFGMRRAHKDGRKVGTHGLPHARNSGAVSSTPMSSLPPAFEFLRSPTFPQHSGSD